MRQSELHLFPSGFQSQRTFQKMKSRASSRPSPSGFDAENRTNKVTTSSSPPNRIALGNIEECRFVDVMGRNADLDENRRVPAGTRVVLRGWAAPPEGSNTPVRVAALVGEQVFELSGGRPRPDVAEVFDDEAFATSGFQGFVSLEGVPLGKHVFRIVLYEENGAISIVESGVHFEIVASRFAFRATNRVGLSEIVVSIDDLTPLCGRGRRHGGALEIEIGETLLVRGWAADLRATALSRGVFGVVDDRDYIMGVHGMPREDVVTVMGDVLPDARKAGFTIRIDTRLLAPGVHRLAIVALGADGASYASYECGEFLLRTGVKLEA